MSQTITVPRAISLTIAVMAIAACELKPGPPLIIRDGGPGIIDAGSDGGSPRNDAGLPLTEACGTLNSRRCDLLTRCGLIGADTESQDACLSFYTATWCGPSGWLARVNPLVNTLRYDPLIAQQCADALQTRSCTGAESLPEACTRFLKPNATGSHACYGDYNECLEGICRGAACPRTCQPRGAVSAPCATDNDCLAGLYCNPSMANPSVSVCTAPVGLNGVCWGGRCTEGLICNTRNMCVPLPEADAGCVQGQCDDYATCKNDAGLCIPRLPDEARCEDNNDCFLNSFCSPQGTGRVCKPTSVVQSGAECLSGQMCPSGNVCQGPTASGPGLCLPPLTAGYRCSASIDCEPHLACLPMAADAGDPFGSDAGVGDAGLFANSSRQCGLRLDDGNPCERDGDCHVFSNCRAGVCLPKPRLGQPCATAIGCLVGACIEPMTSDSGVGACSDPLPGGAPCVRDSDCASESCQMGRCQVVCRP